MDKTLIKRPIITEKSANAAASGTYTFLVADSATKPEVVKTLRAIYKVDATDIRIVNVKPKVRVLGRSIGTIPGYKKAIVKLKKGQSLDVMPK